jgi:phosphatidylserine/phosphatidylglycerophosphate/cardiolipin synthase-like enzyme
MDIKTRLKAKENDNIHLQKDNIKEGVAARKGDILIKTLDKDYKSHYLSKTSFILIVDSNVSMLGAMDIDARKTKKESIKDPSLFWFMHDKHFVGAPSHPFSPKHENDFMHNKALIIDDNTVVTGSYNLSENAESNDENLLVIKSHEVALAYERYFDILYRVYNNK